MPGAMAVTYEVGGDFHLLLLGIDWGHLPHFDDVIDRNNKPHPERWRVRGNSAMMTVIPAWKLIEMLESPEFMEQREKENAKITKELSEAASHVVLDTEPAEFFTKEDFEAALRKVGKKLPKGES